MANLDTYCCPSCGKEFVIRALVSEVPCPACGTAFIVLEHSLRPKSAEAEKHNGSRPNQAATMSVSRSA
jgi:predicted RNA-binding Zn-ribbon protein involved in translation (DUF1610 family)